mmetsp:Transcript_32373/g.60943  ORF Transcript_32373/g.60943 Transcript_32373/m.60943 type:complete len:196 (-) Transcript_32373:93-680(-)
MASRFDVTRVRSRRWGEEVQNISRDGNECVAACHFVFKSCSRKVPNEFVARRVPLHPSVLWSNTRSWDADLRPSWECPSARPSAFSEWKKKAPARIPAEPSGPSFWQSHGSGQGRYGYSEGMRPRRTLGSPPKDSSSLGPLKVHEQSYEDSLRASSLFAGTLEEEQIRGRHSGPKPSPRSPQKLSSLPTVALTPR